MSIGLDYVSKGTTYPVFGLSFCGSDIMSLGYNLPQNKGDIIPWGGWYYYIASLAVQWGLHTPLDNIDLHF